METRQQAKEHELSAEHVYAGYGDYTVLKDVTLKVPAGKISTILGSNGCGKSTLLKTFARLIKPKEGEIRLDGKNIHDISDRLLSKEIGLLPQTPYAPEGIKVADLVARGRFPHRKFMQGLSREDYEAIAKALKMLDIEDLADRPVEELSGGQRQRVWIAMAIAQHTDILLLDEPTTYLDIAHQIEILDVFAELNHKYGVTIVMVLHDINLASRYSDHIFGMAKGELVDQGHPKEIITPDLMKKLYDMESMVMEDPISHTPMVIPIRRCK